MLQKTPMLISRQGTSALRVGHLALPAWLSPAVNGSHLKLSLSLSLSPPSMATLQINAHAGKERHFRTTFSLSQKEEEEENKKKEKEEAGGEKDTNEEGYEPQQATSDNPWKTPAHLLNKRQHDEVMEQYWKNHIPLAQSEFRKWEAPYTDTKELERMSNMWGVHRKPEAFVDKLALGIMRFLRVFVHAFFRDRYLHHSVTLETIAAVPGMVAAMLRHFRSLRTMRRDFGKIGLLLEEAENERIHLLTWMAVSQPTLLERMLVVVAQFGFTTFYTLAYIISPRFCHRLVAYLEEEAFNSYTAFLKAIDEGKIQNVPAPEIAMRYWNLSPDATLRDVVIAVRADEAAHRETNHELSDRAKHGMHYTQETRIH